MITLQYSISLPNASDDEAFDKIQKIKSHCNDLAFVWTTQLVRIEDPIWLTKLRPSPFENCILAPRAYMGFAAGLGEGAKEFHFELYQFPESKIYRVPRCWFSNQTCWVSPSSDDRIFVSRYRAVIDVLEFARDQLGFNVEIKDESGYASAKSVDALLAYKKIKDRYFDPREVMSDNKKSAE